MELFAAGLVLIELKFATLSKISKTKVSTPIKIPTTINKIANKVLYSDAFKFSEIFMPMCNPKSDPNNKIVTRVISIEPNSKAWPATTKIVINTVTNKDVPGTNLVGIEKI